MDSPVLRHRPECGSDNPPDCHSLPHSSNPFRSNSKKITHSNECGWIRPVATPAGVRFCSYQLFGKRRGWIRFPAEKPVRGSDCPPDSHSTPLTSNPFRSNSKKITHSNECVIFLVGEDGFEPSKLEATDLQSAPFGHSGTLPNYKGQILVPFLELVMGLEPATC